MFAESSEISRDGELGFVVGEEVRPRGGPSVAAEWDSWVYALVSGICRQGPARSGDMFKYGATDRKGR